MTNKEYVPREVIAEKLLAALDDGDKVAIVANRQDMNLLCRALAFAVNETPSLSEQDEFKRLLYDLEKLGKSAFGPR